MEGFTSGLISTFLTHPLDTLKSHRQVGTRGSVIDFFRHPRTSGMWNGVGVSCLAMGTFYGFFFPCYERLKKENTPTFVNSYLAGAVGTWFGTPLYTLKVRQQVTRNLSLPECVKLVYQEKGLRGFWRGYYASLGRNMELCIQFPLFEKLKMSGLDNFTAAFIAKFVSSCITFPFDTIRTIQRSGNYKPFTEIVKDVYLAEQSGGLRGFWRGYAPYAIRSVPASAITLGVYGIFRRLRHSDTPQ